MFVENTQPNTRSVGSVVLGPGMNKVDPKEWEKARHSYVVDPLIDEGVLKIHGGREKITVALVEKTYDVPTLENMLEDAKGPLKGAIRKQIKLITDAEPKEEAN